MLNTPSLLWGREKKEIARNEYCNVMSDPFYTVNEYQILSFMKILK